MRRLPNGPTDMGTPHYGRDEMAEYLEQAYGVHARLVYESQAKGGKTTRSNVVPQLRSKAGRKEALLAAVRKNPGLFCPLWLGFDIQAEHEPRMPALGTPPSHPVHSVGYPCLWVRLVVVSLLVLDCL
jgi:hypothetical protein